MIGFNKKFKNFKQYIIDITHEIWEEKKVEKIYEYYADNIIVRSPDGIVKGNKKVVEATHATLAEFPDRQLFAEDVIWCGTPQKGMMSSHRILSTATHNGNGMFGKPTKKKIKYRIIADCHAINNQVNDEWLIRDIGDIVRQLGKTPEQFAKMMIKNEGGKKKCKKPFTNKTDIKGPYKGKGNNNKWGKKLENILKELNKTNFNIIQKEYDRAANLYYPSGVIGIGFEDAEKFWKKLIHCFPNAKFEIHHRIGNEEKNMPPCAAIRWSITGKHKGKGMFGNPTNTNIYIMGITHAEFGTWGLRREYTLIDEVAVWKQIIMQKGE